MIFNLIDWNYLLRTDAQPPQQRYGSSPYYSYCLRRHALLVQLGVSSVA